MACACLAGAPALSADPLTRSHEIDFGRDVASRDLKGLATRSDGRILPGPVLTELTGPVIGELLWTLEPAGTGSPGRWLAGTGPEGKIVEITLDGETYTTREIADLEESQVFALCPLPDGSVLAGTSPVAALCLLKEGNLLARVILPVDSIFDFLILPGAEPYSTTPNSKSAPAVLIATGNPGRIYRLDLAKFAAAGVASEKMTDPEDLAGKGITLFSEIRDRNVRRIARLADGRIAAGSAPRGNVYVFPAAGGLGAEGPAKAALPVILQENREAEVTDLLPQPDGSFYATIVYSSGPGESRISRPSAPSKDSTETGPGVSPSPEPDRPDPPRFSGRSTVVLFPADGFPETLLSRGGLAFYRLARLGDLLLIAAGEQGDLLAWDLKERLSLTFAGSIAAQLNDLAALPGSPGLFLLLRNNAPGLALLDFNGAGPGELITRRLDLGVPSELGKLRFATLRNLALESVQLDVKTSFGSDETEGWTEWSRLGTGDGAHLDARLRGRYLKFRLSVPAGARDFEIGRATLYYLPQNRRPILGDFRVFPANLAINPAPEPAPPASVTVGQILNPNQPPPGVSPDAAAALRRNPFLSSQLVPRPGSQVVYWSVIDADGDALVYTFSIKRVDADAWIDIARGIRDPYVQFDLGNFADGLYLTRLAVEEQAPRPVGDRLSAVFETDDLLIDRAPPEILDANARRQDDRLIVTVRGRDALSLLGGVSLAFNNGWRETVEHPADGILDGREETFEASVPADKISGATAVEIQLADQAGNAATRRLDLER